MSLSGTDDKLLTTCAIGPRDAVIGMPAVAEIGEQRIGIPRHRRRRRAVDRISKPVIDLAAGELHAPALCAERVARGVTCAAMREALDEVGAAIPFRALSIVRLV